MPQPPDRMILAVLTALGIALDVYHWGHQPKFIDRLPQLAPRLALVQLGDGREPPSGEPNRCPLGDGTIPLKPAMQLSFGGFLGAAGVGDRVYFEMGDPTHGPSLWTSTGTPQHVVVRFPCAVPLLPCAGDTR